jgi:Spy/CpxP family protein refolding chaperone
MLEQRMDQRGPQGLGPQGRQGQGRQGRPGMMNGRGPAGRGPGFGLRGLDLTEEQRTQVKAIHEQTRIAIDNILTPEQKARRRGGR